MRNGQFKCIIKELIFILTRYNYGGISLNTLTVSIWSSGGIVYAVYRAIVSTKYKVITDAI